MKKNYIQTVDTGEMVSVFCCGVCVCVCVCVYVCMCMCVCVCYKNVLRCDVEWCRLTLGDSDMS